MKTPEILQSLNTCSEAIETALLTTIHLINGDRIITEIDDFDNSEPIGSLDSASLQII